ncbi:MAG: transglutaminase-like domain-containing protein [Candidatus Binatia bacterium]
MAKFERALVLVAAVVAAGAAALAAGGSAGDPWKTPARYEFEYRVGLEKIAPQGGRVSLWVPYPAENDAQKLLQADVRSPWPWELRTEKKFGNRMIYTEGPAESAKGDFVLRVEVERRPYAGVRRGAGAFEGNLSPALYGGPDRLVPHSGLIEKIAREESRGLSTNEEKIQAFYDYVYRTMTYNKDGKGWGEGDAIWACTSKRGNCTDFHSLFIGMLRSQEIPARFLIGFPIPDGEGGEIGGYHCWAEFYDDRTGWLPVDASEAKKKGLKEAYFGALPNDRIEFTLGRDVVLDPPQKGEALNYFIYPYAEVDGKAAGEPVKSFRFRRLPSGVSS